MLVEEGREGTARTESRCCWSLAPHAPPRALCCRCAHKRRASPLTCLAVCFLVLTYNLLGGFLFLALEGTNSTHAEDTAVAASKPNLSHSHAQGNELRTDTVERLWSITEDLNILYKENWTKLAAKELMDFQKVLIETMRSGVAGEGQGGSTAEHYRRWTFSTSFLYALTLITTIGAGHVIPSSPLGKFVGVVYACLGIPLIMLYLSTVGEALARALRALYSRVRPTQLYRQSIHCDRDKLDRHKRTPFQAALNLDSFSGGYHWTCREHTRVPVVISVLVIVSYIALGTLVFHNTERWSLVDGCYFSFASLATIGFGELRPGLYASTISAQAEDIAIGVCCIYILVGIVVIAMCFNLIQEELTGVLRGLSALCAGRSGAASGARRAVHSVEVSHDDKLAMSVLS